MTKENIMSNAVALIADQLGISPESVTPTSHIQNDLGADSLDIVEMMMMLEDAFNMEIPDEIMEKTDTVEKLVNYIHEQKTKNSES